MHPPANGCRSPPPSAGVTPRDYANAVSLYAQRNIFTSIYPGEHFDGLAKFLMRGFSGSCADRRPSRFPPVERPGEFATLYWMSGSDENQLRHLHNVEELKKLFAEGAGSTPLLSSILFLKGQPSPSWLAGLGSFLSVDPVVFQRHLELVPSFGGRRCFFSPPLPSAEHDTIRLKFPTIGTRWTNGHSNIHAHVDATRRKGAEEMKQYLHLSSVAVNVALGNSIVRSYHVHDAEIFSIEQHLSISLHQLHGKWIVLVWTDAGRDLNEGPKGPWLDSHNEQVIPTFQHLPELHRRSGSIPTTTESHLKGPFPPSAALLPCNYGRFLDKSLMAKDAFYAVHDIFGFCASAICQFLNMVESVIEEETGFAAMSNTQYSLSTLLYHQDVLEKQTRDLRSSIEKIRARGGSSWPHAQEGDGKEDAEAAAHSLMRDYEELLFRAHTLSKRCKSGIAVLMSQASIEESKKAISQTEKMKALTLLGFFYLPLSFTTSFFGMNLGAVGTGGKMGIWVWFVVSIPVLLISFGFLKLMTFRLR